MASAKERKLVTVSTSLRFPIRQCPVFGFPMSRSALTYMDLIWLICNHRGSEQNARNFWLLTLIGTFTAIRNA